MNRVLRVLVRGVFGVGAWMTLWTAALWAMTAAGGAAEPATSAEAAIPEFSLPAPAESLTPVVRERLDAEISEATLRPVIEFLASPECEGRFSNTPGSARAAERLAEWLAEIGCEPLGTDGFFQPFIHPGFDPDWPRELNRRLKAMSDGPAPDEMESGETADGEVTDGETANGETANGEAADGDDAGAPVKPERATHRPIGRNVVGVLRGSDPQLADEYILLVAHYDHMGRTSDQTWIGAPIAAVNADAAGDAESANGANGESAERAPPEPGEYRPGADDNASGCAANLVIGRFLAALPERPKRSVMIAFVDAEELGLLGSTWLAGHLPIEREKIVFVINSDMLGRVRSNRVAVGGEQSAVGMRAMLRRLDADPAFVAADGAPFEFLFRGVIGPMSDHWPFMKLGVPGAMFHSMAHADYHQPTDTTDRINFADMVPLTRIAAAMVYEISQDPQRPATPAGFESEAYVDLAASDAVLTALEQEWGFEYATDTSDPGVLVVGDVQADTPAQRAGLLTKDRILAIRTLRGDEAAKTGGETAEAGKDTAEKTANATPIDFETWWNAGSAISPVPATQTAIEDVMDAIGGEAATTEAADESPTVEPAPDARRETVEYAI